MTISKPWLCTKVEIWSPRYKDKSAEGQESYVVLLAKYKVHHASPVILVEFTKAKHLKGQRFAIRRDVAERCPPDTNGKIACYAVPLDKFEHWDSAEEVRDIALNLFET